MPWADYERAAAAINAMLSQFAEVGDDSESAHGFITRELVDAAARITLDRTHLRSFLPGYQTFSAQYLLTRGKSILGDEMGLGKTVQALAVAAHLTAKINGHTLVVCPTGVISNWVNETHKYTDLRPWQIHGAERDALLAEWDRHFGVAITTFDTLKALRVTTDPDLLVVDGANFVKNPVTHRAKALREVLARSGRAVLMSGTPMENRVEEFKSLVGYVQLAVASRIRVRDGLGRARAFRKVVAPAYLRRNQEDVLTELPELIEVEDWVLLDGQDRAAYRAAVLEGNFMAMRQAAYAFAGSAKLERIIEIVDEARENDAKVLAFSHFRGVLETIRGAVPGTVYGPITGSTSVARGAEAGRRVHRAPRAREPACPGRGWRARAERPSGVCGDSGGAAMEAEQRVAGHRSGPSDGADCHGPCASGACEGQCRRVNAGHACAQEWVVRRVRTVA